jgi:hypothetical protein
MASITVIVTTSLVAVPVGTPPRNVVVDSGEPGEGTRVGALVGGG